MGIDDLTERRIRAAASLTPEPGRAERNLRSVLEAAEEPAAIVEHMEEAALLCASSQFLANHCARYPDDLVLALADMGSPYTRGTTTAAQAGVVVDGTVPPLGRFMTSIRRLRKRHLLSITLRDLTSRTSLPGNMDELTAQAEDAVGIALKYSLARARATHGEPAGGARICILGMGKLGAEELNYSSDVDLIAAYAEEGPAGGQTAGVLNPAGIRANRISNHEFYCKVVETLSRSLSTLTEDGVAYRVDLRLRPEGQRGQIALPLGAYQSYYETWGRTWERMALMRVRPVAGDMALGAEFMAAISPFVWRRTMDYSEIEEIKSMKKKIDATFSRDDIKRGYGGIREAEFFVQTFQLLYGADRPELRANRLLEAIAALRTLGLIPDIELDTLRENYLFLRRLEHYLQMKDDLQTHTLPRAGEDLEALGRKMGHRGREEFLSELSLRRKQVKDMYNSLLGTREDRHGEALALLEGDLPDDALGRYLKFKGVLDPDRCVQSIGSIRERTVMMKTRSEISTVRRVVPVLLENALASMSPDRALQGLEKFFTALEIKEAHLTGMAEHGELMTGVVRLMALSSTLTHTFLSSTEYLNLLIEENVIRKTKKRTSEELKRALQRAGGFGPGAISFKLVEEVRLGIFFLSDVLTVQDLMRYLSHLAECLLEAATHQHARQQDGLAVIALGKLGGREITFGSDLDVLFVSSADWGPRAAEKVMLSMTEYTERGVLYDMDTRLRPDGSKGALVKDLEGYREYYLNHAQDWEIQALLRARAAAGDPKLKADFVQMAREVVLRRGPNVKRRDVEAMRTRILKELSREHEGVDVKLGPGGLEEVEFFTQWLQLTNAASAPEVLVQNTMAALDVLARKDLISPAAHRVLSTAFGYYRKLETFLRLNGERVLSPGSNISAIAATFMGHRGEKDFITHLNRTRARVRDVVSKG